MNKFSLSSAKEECWKLTGSGLFFLAMVIYLFRAELVTTNFAALINTNVLRVISNIAVITLLLVKIVLFDRYTLKKFLQIVCFMIIGVVTTVISGYDVVFVLYLFVLAAKNVSFYKIVRLHFTYALTCVLAAFVASQRGFIENTISYRDGIARQSFGIIYCTDFAAHIFYLMVSYIYLRGNKLKYFELGFFTIITSFVYVNSNARLDCACMAILILFLLVKKITFGLKGKPIYTLPKHPWMEKCMAWSMPICAMFSIGITYLFSSNSVMWLRANSILNNRLTQGAEAISKYDFNFFGQIVEVQGQAGVNTNISEYFFIDSSFLLYGLRFGLIFLFIFCIGSTLVMMREIKKQNAIFCTLFFLIAVNSIFSHHLIELAYNPFLLFFLAKVDNHPNMNIQGRNRKIKFMVRKGYSR